MNSDFDKDYEDYVQTVVWKEHLISELKKCQHKFRANKLESMKLSIEIRDIRDKIKEIKNGRK